MKTAAVDPPPSIVAGAATARSNGAVADFAELVKARLTLLVLLTTAVGYYLGVIGPVELLRLFHVVFGTALAAAGAAALNQWWERQLDGLMHRTCTRPLPAGRMSARDALLLGAILSAGGVVYLAVACNSLSALLAGTTIAIYILGYTPLKRVSTANTLVGAVPGALPPMIGWAAARNDLDWSGWCLFAILFCWQMPHFFAIAWLYRDDYARAGFCMLSSRDAGGKRSARQSVGFGAMLVLASTLPTVFGITTGEHLWLQVGCGTAFLALAMRFAFRRDEAGARALFIGSIIYLPLLLALLVATKR